MLSAFITWWYGAGWQRQAASVSQGIAQLSDTFSFGLLLKTLFSPFRQISSGTLEGPLGVQMRAMVDKLVSRLIGAMVRSTVLFAGAIVIAVYAVFGLVRIVLWPVWPSVPLAVGLLWSLGVFSWS